MTEDRWEPYDLPTLQAIARLEDRADTNFGVSDIARETGFEPASVKRSLRRLEGGYVTFTALPGDDDPLLAVRNIRLLPDGRRITKQWPNLGDDPNVINTAGAAVTQTSAVSEVAQGYRTWVAGYRPALVMALQEFLASAEWPERERFRRRLVQRSLDHVNLDELLATMPKSWWEPRPVLPERVLLSLQVLKELPEAQTLLAVSLAIVKRAYELYSSDDDEVVLRSDDSSLVSAAHDDAHLLLCGREVVSQHVPHPLGGGTGGTVATEWTRTLNEGAMPAFKQVATIDDYLTAQERTMTEERRRYGQGWAGQAAPEPTTRTEVFIVHGHDGSAKHAVARFVQQVTERTPVILHERANRGRTVIEKFEDVAATIAFAIVVLTGDDFGGIKGELDTKPRARQNVIFEMGFFFSAIGRDRVAVIYEDDVELPSDVRGILYTPFDEGGSWKMELNREMAEAGIAVDLNNAR